jgi:hypothetical protein
MLLAEHAGTEKITKALLEMRDWYVAETVLWVAFNAAEDDCCDDD